MKVQPIQLRAPGPRPTPGIPIKMFARQDWMRVLRDGTAVVLRGGEYRVDRIGTDGAVTHGPSRASERTAVTDEGSVLARRLAERQRWSPVATARSGSGRERGALSESAPLQTARSNQSEAVIDFVLDNGASLPTETGPQFQLMYSAATNGSSSVFELMFDVLPVRLGAGSERNDTSMNLYRYVIQPPR